MRILRTGRGPGASRSGGFTLLEVLLAFVIFALSFATVLEILSGSLRSTMRARDYSEAALLAQHRRVEVEQLEVGCGRRVHLAAQLIEELIRRAADRVVHLDADLADGLLRLVRADVDLLKVALRDGE